MSLRSRLARFSPLRLVGASDAVSRLERRTSALQLAQKDHARTLRKMTQQLDRLEALLRRQQAVLDEIPNMQEKLGQAWAVYLKDAREAGRMPAARALLADTTRIGAHAAAAVGRARLVAAPTPHVVIQDLLPDDVYDELIRAIPSVTFFKSRDPTRQETQVPFVFAPEHTRLVWGTFYDTVVSDALIRALTAKFGSALDDFVRTHWPAYESLAAAGIELQVSNSRILLRGPGYEIKPHRDPRWAFLTCLLYLPRPRDTSAYGTQLYRLREEPVVSHGSPLWVDEGLCELAVDVPARRNTALVFLNATGAHGATIPPDAPAGTKRYLYQVQFGVDERTQRRLVETLDVGQRPGWVTRAKGY